MITVSFLRMLGWVADICSSIQFNQKILLDLCNFQWRRNGRGREG